DAEFVHDLDQGESGEEVVARAIRDGPPAAGAGVIAVHAHTATHRSGRLDDDAPVGAVAGAGGAAAVRIDAVMFAVGARRDHLLGLDLAVTVQVDANGTQSGRSLRVEFGGEHARGNADRLTRFNP